MRICAVAFLALLALTFDSVAQDKPPEGVFAKRCEPKRLTTKPASAAKPDKLESIQSYKRAPTVKFQISAEGSVSDLKLTSGSGSSVIDRYALHRIAQWKFNSRPGCPIVESKTTIQIEWK
jgi:TonB family protein